MVFPFVGSEVGVLNGVTPCRYGSVEGGRMDSIYPGELCPSCGEVPLDGDDNEEVECPNCGAVVVISGNWGD